MKALTPIKAIRQNCIACSGGSKKEVKLCVIPECPLYPYRLGTNTNRKKRPMTQEEIEKATQNLKKAREMKTN